MGFGPPTYGLQVRFRRFSLLSAHRDLPDLEFGQDQVLREVGIAAINRVQPGGTD